MTIQSYAYGRFACNVFWATLIKTMLAQVTLLASIEKNPPRHHAAASHLEVEMSRGKQSGAACCRRQPYHSLWQHRPAVIARASYNAEAEHAQHPCYGILHQEANAAMNGFGTLGTHAAVIFVQRCIWRRVHRMCI